MIRCMLSHVLDKYEKLDWARGINIEEVPSVFVFAQSTHNLINELGK